MILPCPHCAKEATLLTSWSYSIKHVFDYEQVNCENCGLRGPEFPNRDTESAKLNAIKYWNKIARAAGSRIDQ